MDKKLRSLTIEKYASAQTEVLLERLAWQVSHTTKRCDPESIHDLCEEVRHLANCLRVFKQFFAKPERKEIQHQLQALTKLAGEVRNRDIALEVLASVLGVQDEDLSTQLAKERKQVEVELVKALQRWTRRNLFRKWRGKLEL
jgi:CHAD domain-containing protein